MDEKKELFVAGWMACCYSHEEETGIVDYDDSKERELAESAYANRLRRERSHSERDGNRHEI